MTSRGRLRQRIARHFRRILDDLLSTAELTTANPCFDVPGEVKNPASHTDRPALIPPPATVIAGPTWTGPIEPATARLRLLEEQMHHSHLDRYLDHHHFRVGLIALDCDDPATLAAFWTALLDGEVMFTSDDIVAVKTDRLSLAAVRMPGLPTADTP